MSVFTPAISCLITSNLPLFINLTFQVSVQYFSLQYHILLSVPNTSTTGCHFHFGSVSSCVLELFFWSSPTAYWTPAYLWVSAFSVISFCLFILFMEFSRQECQSGFPFPFPVDHVLSELSIMTRPSWVALHGMGHSFIELHKAVIHMTARMVTSD